MDDEVAVAPAIAAPVPVLPTSSPSGRMWLYILVSLFFFLVFYLVVVYVRDIQRGQKRDALYNVRAYLEHTCSVANRLPHGHAVHKADVVVPPRLSQTHRKWTESEESSEEDPNSDY